MIRVFTLILLVFGVCFPALSKNVVVTVNVDNRQDYIVRQHARLEAKKQGLLTLPLFVGGKETLINGEFRQEINALGLAAVDVEKVNERWFEGKYELTANVSIDTTKTLDLIDKLESDTALREQLNAAYAQIEKLTTVQDRQSVIDTHLAIFGIKEAWVKRDTIADTLAAKNAIITEQINVLYSAYLLPLLSGHVFSVTEIDEQFVTVVAEHNPDFERKWQDYQRFLASSTYLSDAHELRSLPSICVYYGDTFVNTLAGRYRDSKRFKFHYRINSFSERIPHENNDLLINGLGQRLSVQLCSF